METQNIAVAFIVLLALTYVGLILFKKLKSFTSKGSCGDGCGCSTGSRKSKPAKI